MADLLFVVIVVAFFAITVAYVKACDHIIGPDPDLSSAPDTPPGTAVDAPDAPAGTPADAVSAGGRPASIEVETTRGAW
jgi:hypothetical protein